MTAADIEIALATRTHKFSYRAGMVLPNVSWGMGVHECDMFSVTKAGYVHEVEIKISVADLKKDADKTHNHVSNKIKYLWFAAPLKMQAALEQYAPARAGILCLHKSEFSDHHLVVDEIRQPIPNKDARKLTHHEQAHLGYLAACRYWTMRATLASLLKDIEDLRKERI